MLKLDRLTLEPRFIDQNICFCGGGSDNAGAGSGAVGDTRPDSAASGGVPSDMQGKSSGKGDSGPDTKDDSPSKGNTFGVDGKSITGSMEQDAKLGYTDGIGTGKKGPNFDALNAATAESLAAAKNTAGLVSGDDAKDAVANSLANYTSGDVTNAGNFTDQGKAKAQANIQAALDAQAAQAQVSADRVLGAPDFVTSVPTAATTSPTFTGMPNQLGMPTNPTASIVQDQINSQVAAKQAQTAENLSSILAGLQNQAKITQPSSLPTSPFGPSAPTTDPEAEAFRAQEAQLAQAQGIPVGIMSTPQATAANVVGRQAGQPMDLGMSPGAMGGLTSFADTSINTFGSPEERALAASVTPASDTIAASGMPATSTTAPGQLSSAEMSALDALAARGFEDETAEMGLRASDLTPDQIADNIAANTGYTDAGLPRGLDFVDTTQGRFSTNLAGPTAKQAQEAPGYLSTIDPVTGEVKQGFIPGAVNMVFGNPIQQAYGFEIPDYDPNNPDASTGQITGVVGPPAMGLPGPIAAGINFLTDLVSPDPKTISSSEELLTSMPSVYTGFGPGSELGFDPDAGGRTDPPKAPNDPCPPGYQMINGTCTPVDQREEDTGTGFQINPVTGLPTLFAPFTQATPFAGANPFALQPYTPNQAQYIQQQRSGLQTLSPTGAALGKQV